MSNPTQAQIDKLTVNLTRWDTIVNGSSETTVSLDSHTVNTVTNYLQQLAATNPRGAWGTTTAYALKDIVVQSSVVYICTLAHTSGTFSTDLAAGKWAVHQLDVTSAIFFGDNFTVDTDVFHVDATNNRVGIGTASPSARLDVVRNSPNGSIQELVIMSAGTQSAGSSGSGVNLTFKHSLGYYGAVGGYSNGSAGIGLWANTKTGTPNLYINSSGNIGIGTASPAYKLHVVSGSSGGATASTTGDDLVIENSASAGISVLSPDANNASLFFGSVSDNDYAYLQGFYNSGSPLLRVGILGAEIARFTSTGRLGIGTPSPATLLHVAGGGTFTGELSVDSTTQSTSTTSGSIHTDGGLGVAKNLNLGGKLGLGAASQLTISSGAITITKTFHKLQGEGDTTDDLNTINGGSEGDIVVLRNYSSGYAITIKDATGNLSLAGDFIMNSAGDMIMLCYNGSDWAEVCRSNNA